MPRPAAKKAPTTYREAYAALARIAAELESGEADLDRVLPLIQEAQAAYEVCRGRIEALQAALGEGSVVTGEEDTAAEEEDTQATDEADEAQE
ncbi:exodeoxyribonuclease VII small subunit [Deinococcus altitudinis]|uniref:exodeoxyribonuclease VII small subunit n=1 Tax=Deinococcus altitudinis TaxID=468914 RepID=UPI003892B8F6